MLDREFEHIFQEAARNYQVDAPSTTWSRIRNELDNSRGYKVLNYIWGVRIGIAAMLALTFGLNLYQSYDSIEQIQYNPPVDYEALAVEMNLLPAKDAPLAEVGLPEVNQRLKEVQLKNESSNQYLASEDSPIELNQPNNSSLVASIKPVKPNSKNTISTNNVGSQKSEITTSIETDKHNTPDHVAGLSMAMIHPELSLGQLEANPISFEPQNGYWIEGKTINKSLYVIARANAGLSTLEFVPGSITSLYVSEDENVDFIINSQSEFTQIIQNNFGFTGHVGKFINDHWAVESGINYNYISGSQIALIQVERQDIYVNTRIHPVPNREGGSSDFVSISEEVVESNTTLDTISTRFIYRGFEIPILIKYRTMIGQSKWSIALQTGLSTTISSNYSSASVSSRFSDLQRERKTQSYFIPTEVSALGGLLVEYKLNSNWFIGSGIDYRWAIPFESNTMVQSNYQSIRLGLGLHYYF